jgi:hypothetical protein
MDANAAEPSSDPIAGTLSPTLAISFMLTLSRTRSPTPS